jgi:membrane associated rhomboid family serine protease
MPTPCGSNSPNRTSQLRLPSLRALVTPTTVFAFPRLTPVVRILLFVFGGAYLGTVLLQQWGGVAIFQHLSLYPADVGIHTLWQLVTYVLVWPPDPGHVLSFLIAMLFLWLMLAPFEERFGGRRTWQLALTALLSAALLALVVGQIAPAGPRQVLYGLQPILLGTLAAFSWSLRGRGRIMFFGVIPMQALTVLYVALGISLLLFLTSKSWVGLAADLGAIGGGVGFVHWMMRPPGRRRAPRSKSSAFKVVRGGHDRRWLN